MLAGHARLGARAGSSRRSSSSSVRVGGSGAGAGACERRTSSSTCARPGGVVAARPSSLAASSSSYGNGNGSISSSSSSSSSSSASVKTSPEQQQQPQTPNDLFAADAPSAAAARQELFNSISPVYDELNDRLSFGMHRVWKRMAVRWALRGDGGAARLVQQSSSSSSPSPSPPSPPPRRALDVCCGSGDLALLLADALEAEWGRYGRRAPSNSSSSPLEVVGLDFAADMLSDAARRERRERRRPLVAEEQQQQQRSSSSSSSSSGSSSSSSSSSSAPQRARMQWVQGDATQLPFPDASFGAATVGYGLRNVADPPKALRELARVLAPGASLAVLDFNNARGSGDWLADAAQGLFLERVVVPEAEKFGMREQYAYLRPSVHAYPPGAELERMALGAGFRYARHYPLALGMMGCLVATR